MSILRGLRGTHVPRLMYPSYSERQLRRPYTDDLKHHDPEDSFQKISASLSRASLRICIPLPRIPNIVG